jgi:two-component system sensor histidine kinase UhpB
VNIIVETTGLTDRLPMQLETVLFRVAQEAISNIARHAQASTARISLACEGTRVKAVVEDNGKGFNTEEVLELQRGLGLLGMKERVVLLGGTFNIQSQPGKGTRIEIEVPLSGEG